LRYKGKSDHSYSSKIERSYSFLRVFLLIYLIFGNIYLKVFNDFLDFKTLLEDGCIWVEFINTL